MQLTAEEERMLRGEMGQAVKDALDLQRKVGEFFGAERFVPVTNVHMMGDIEVMGTAGLDYLKCLDAQHAHCVADVTTNARSIDFDRAIELNQDRAAIGQEKELIGCLKRMNVMTTDTCINYQTLYQPHRGEHVAWGDTGTVIYANSVFGARSNFESGPVALAAGLTRRVPAYGFHLDQCRCGTFVVEVEATMRDLADWGALGKLVGENHQSYWQVPVFTGIERAPVADELKHLGCSLASYGSMAMFHMVGVTPEAPSVEAALGGNSAEQTITITDADIENVYRNYDLGDGNCNLVVFSGPQLSLFEMKRLAELLDGRTVRPGTKLFVTTSNGVKSAAAKLGYLAQIEQAGGIVLEGVCFYILQNLSQMRRDNGWNNLVSNSAKLVNTIVAHKFNTILRRTEECVDIAVNGRLS